MSVRKRLARPDAATVLLAAAAQVGIINVPPAHAQSSQNKSETAPKLEFEVASVRPSGPLPRGMILRGRISGGPGTNDPERITCEFVPFEYLIMAAYGVQVYQIRGPEWVTPADLRSAARFDISATAPQGTTKEQAATMLQKLLAERFQLKLHHETAQFPGYALVVAKGGSKLKQSRGPVEESERAKGPAGGVGNQTERDGFPVLAPGSNMGGRTERDGTVRLRFRDYPLSDLTQQLSSALTAHLVDRTGVAGKYDFTLEFALPPEGFIVGVQASLPLSPGETAPLYREPGPAEQDAVAIVSAALEKQLGLKLEATKITMDTLVIDHVEKTPTDN
jgi:uncharacterized protein (TIGR03435 family)